MAKTATIFGICDVKEEENSMRKAACFKRFLLLSSLMRPEKK